MDPSKYLIATDLDGAFVHEGEVVPQNIEAVYRFVAGGGYCRVPRKRDGKRKI